MLYNDQILTTDPRLCDHLDSQVFPHLVQFLEQDVEAVYEDDITKEGPEDNKSFKFQVFLINSPCCNLEVRIHGCGECRLHEFDP